MQAEGLQDKDLQEEGASDKYHPPPFYYLEDLGRGGHGGSGEDEAGRIEFGVGVGTRQCPTSAREQHVGGWEGHANKISEIAISARQQHQRDSDNAHMRRRIHVSYEEEDTCQQYQRDSDNAAPSEQGAHDGTNSEKINLY
jgi:hypothetical protein